MRWHWGGGEPGETTGGPPAAAPAPTATAPAPGFIGRTAEQETFRTILDDARAGRSGFIHLTGTARSGRRALLDQFRTLAGAAGARCGPVVDLEDDAGLELDELLERIANALEPERDRFGRFFDAAKRFRSREAGLPTMTSQAVAVVRAGSSAVSQLAGTLPVKAINAAVQSPIGDLMTEHAETRRTLGAVSEEFVTGLLELAKADRPILLVFGNLDFSPSSAKLLWLRRSLLPRIAHARVVVAVSTEPRFELDDVGPLFDHPEQMALDRFDEEEAEQFLERHIKLPKDSPLGRAVLEDSDRFPERLAGYARYFEDHPEARTNERLPTEARDLTSGGLVSGLLGRVGDPFLREVLLHAAPLRWFNAELLTGIADACGLTPAADGPGAAGLLDIGQRPSWVSNLGGGWGIDVEARRRAVVDEFRRLHPGLYRRVHLHAARYHVTRLRELEGAVPGDAGLVSEQDVIDYQPVTYPTDRLRWEEYLAALAEWLYHLIALSPRRGFARLADHVGEALAWERPTAAVALLDIGVEVALPGSEALARQRLLEVVRSVHNGRHADTLQLLDEFSAGGSASAIADAAAHYLAGTRLVLLGRSPLAVHDQFERAETLLGGTDDGVQARTLRCLNLTQLAAAKARRDEHGDAGLAVLVQAAELAESLDPRMRAEVKRVRGLILAGTKQGPEALVACGEALELLSRTGAAAEAARVLCLRAELNLDAGQRPAARRDLLSAQSIYRQLVEPEAEAGVLVGLVDIALRAGDDAEVAELERAITRLRPDEALLRSQIGSLFLAAHRPEAAVERFSAALAIASDAGTLARRGRAHLEWATQTEDDAQARALRRQAGDDLHAAYQLDPDDLDTGIELAELRRRLGDGAAALETAALVARRALEAARTLPPLPARELDDDAARAARAAILGRLRDLLVRGVSLLGPAAAAEIIDAWIAARLPADEELELIRAIAGHELATADPDALPAALEAAARAAATADPPRGRALVELAALQAAAGRWSEATGSAQQALADEAVRVQAEYMLDQLDQKHRRDDEFGGEPEAVVEELVIDIAEDLRTWFDPQSTVGGEFFAWMVEEFRRRRAERVGLPAPGLWVGMKKDLPAGNFQVVVDNGVRARIRVEGDLLAGAAPGDCPAGGRPGTRPWDGGPATWLPAGAADDLIAAGIPFWDPRGLVLAALDAALEVSPRFLSAETAASLSGEDWSALEAEEYFARADVVRRLLGARVPPRELPGVLRTHDAAVEADRAAVIDDAVRRLAVAPVAPEELAAFFEFTRFQPEEAGAGPTAKAVVVGVRLGPGGGGDAVVASGRRVLAVLCGALHLPVPELRVEEDPGLGADEVAVSIGAVTRLVARPTEELDWWRCHSAAGPGGRTGAGAGDRAARALEAVLWDDPALLIDGAGAPRGPLTAVLGTEPSERVARSLLDVLGRRVPLGPQPALKRAVEHVLDRSASGSLRQPGAKIVPSKPRRPVPDNLPFGIRDTIPVEERGRLRYFAVRVLLHHDDQTDVRISLTSPSGTTAILHEFGDDLDRLRSGVDADRVPALACFNNEPAEGDWTLHVQDFSSPDAGLLEEWAVELTTVSSQAGTAETAADPEIALSRHERDAMTRSASLERDLRSRRIVAECGARVWTALEEGTPDGRLQRERVRLGTHLARELGLRFGHSIHFTLVPTLADDGFRILVNDLVRATGDLPPGRYGPSGASGDEDVWVGPLSGLPHRRLAAEVPGGFDVPDRLMRHIRAAVREAAVEFADADWASVFLDRLCHSYPKTVPAARTAAGDDLLAAVLRELVTHGIAVADPQLMDLVRELVQRPDLARECMTLAAAPPTHLGRTAGAMAEWLREHLDGGQPEDGVPLVELGPAIEAAVRAAVGSCDGRVPVYSLAGAGDILRLIEDARIELGATQIGVVTAAPLRRHVHRLIAAQFPTAAVLARERLDPALPRRPIDLPAAG